MRDKPVQNTRCVASVLPCCVLVRLLGTIGCTDIYRKQGGARVGHIGPRANWNCDFSLDPQFRDTLSGDFGILVTSPCATDLNPCGRLLGAIRPECHPSCGDANGDSVVNLADAVFLVGFIFAGGAVPTPVETGDVNCGGVVDISDAVVLIAYLFENTPLRCV